MQIRHLKIERFRGIKLFEWNPPTTVACLIGPGDSTKTTILDAVELALGSRWAVSILDSDFYGGSPVEPIVITATVGRLAADLCKEEKYGMDLRGWNSMNSLHDEPMPGDEAVLTIQFLVDDSFEPSWLVINDRRPEGRAIPSRDRELFGVARLGGDVDRHLAWGRGSALSRTTDDIVEINRVIAAAQREARTAISNAPLKKLNEAATKAQNAAERLGVRISDDYKPGLDPVALGLGASQLSLHQAGIPVRSAGLGTRRLNALALQTIAVKAGALLLIDEVEQGLEPHRLRHLLGALQAVSGTEGQVLLTTHSRVPIEELASDQLFVVRSANGQTTATQVGRDMQDFARGNAEALLGRRILVCEGPTEIGLCRGLRSFWARRHSNKPFGYTGVALARGGGSEAEGVALNTACILGFDTALFRDSDVETILDAGVLAGAGVQVFEWAGGTCTEERIALDLPWKGLQAMVDLAVEESSTQSVIDAVQMRLQLPVKVNTTQLDSWLEAGATQAKIRVALGDTAKTKKWFKRVDRGEALGRIVATSLPSIPGTDLSIVVLRVGDWVYAD